MAGGGYGLTPKGPAMRIMLEEVSAWLSAEEPSESGPRAVDMVKQCQGMPYSTAASLIIRCLSWTRDGNERSGKVEERGELLTSQG